MRFIMSAIKERIKENLEFLNEQQLMELADFSSFLKIRSRVQKSKILITDSFNKFKNEDSTLAEYGMAEYNKGLLEEDLL